MSFEVGRVLESNEPFRLNISDIVTKRTFIDSATRMGKSYLNRKIVEECVGHAGIIIVDPEGEYSSLREKFPFLIIGRDIPLQLETAEFMADKVLETKISVIIDTSMVEEELGKEYVNRFLKRFFFLETVARHPYLVIIEEAEDFGPEKGSPSTATCLGILINLVKRGGKRGIGVILVAHRPAWVSKGIISQCKNKAVGNMEEVANDLSVLENYAGIPKTAVAKLPHLKTGEFCFAGEWAKNVTFVKVGPVKTTHLGYTPDTSQIPPSPKEIQGTIADLQVQLPKVIESVKPTVASHAEVEAKIRKELETKNKDRIEAILKTADEKADRKYRVEIDKLKQHIEELSRSKALEQASPISDVLEHPIVKSRMLELDEKARILLTKVEHEPGVSREQLAAFLTASKDSVANIVDKVNKVFRAQVIIGEGKPIHYKSMLKRLYITDVAKREIEELTRLQQELLNKARENEGLRTTNEGLKEVNKEYSEKLRDVLPALEKAQKTCQQQTSDIEKLKREKGELELRSKAGMWLGTAITEIVDRRLKELKETLAPPTTAFPKAAGILNPITSPIDEKRILEIVKQHTDPLLQKQKDLEERLASGVTPQASGTEITLDQKVTSFDLKKNEEHLKTDTGALHGRILKLILEGFFEARHNRKQIVEELSNHGWVHEDKEVDGALLELCGKGVFYRKISTGNALWYTLQPEAKERIHE